ncbi:(2Fe-2S) ferredoxin domain-containing protein [Planktothrix sp. FACHB-1365]|nr:(2Fe-2S) ferredoxin domain-containing protein [Planktothrix sp. FACHB-1365]
MMGISNLAPGQEVRVKGQKKQDFKTGKIKLKAEQILPAFPPLSTLTPLFGDESPESASENLVLSSSLSVQTSTTSNILYSPIQEDYKTSEICPSVIPGEPVQQPAVKPAKILICQKSDCRKRGGDAICTLLQQELAQRGLEDQVTIQKTGCLKKCKAGPNLVMLPDKTRYSKVEPEKIPALIEQHF